MYEPSDIIIWRNLVFLEFVFLNKNHTRNYGTFRKMENCELGIIKNYTKCTNIMLIESDISRIGIFKTKFMQEFTDYFRKMENRELHIIENYTKYMNLLI